MQKKMQIDYQIITSNDLEELTKNFPTSKRQFTKGSILNAVSFHHYELGIILSGTIDLIRHDYNGNRIIIEKLEKNFMLGNIFVKEDIDSISLIVSSNCEILFLNLEEFANLSPQGNYYSPKLVSCILKLLVKTTRDKDNRIRILTKKGLRERIIEYFNTLYEKSNNTIIFIPYSYTDLADYLSVNRSSMCRELKRMQKDGLISCTGVKKFMLHYL